VKVAAVGTIGGRFFPRTFWLFNLPAIAELSIILHDERVVTDIKCEHRNAGDKSHKVSGRQ
jgi:hypothetical protein